MPNERVRTVHRYNLHLVDRYDCYASEYPSIYGVSVKPERMVGFNYALSMPDERKRGACCHFFLDDYQFERVWSHPERYLRALSGFDCVLTPDFSLYTDMPYPMQQWNTYRNRACGYWWQEMGLTVVPTLSWSTPRSYLFAFGGLPKHSTVAVSTIGVMMSARVYELWRGGMDEALERLEPERVLLYGNVPDYDFGNAEVVPYSNDVTQKMEALHGRKG